MNSEASDGAIQFLNGSPTDPVISVYDSAWTVDMVKR